MLWLETYLAHSIRYCEIVFSQYQLGGLSRAHVSGVKPKAGLLGHLRPISAQSVPRSRRGPALCMGILVQGEAFE